MKINDEIRKLMEMAGIDSEVSVSRLKREDATTDKDLDDGIVFDDEAEYSDEMDIELPKPVVSGAKPEKDMSDKYDDWYWSSSNKDFAESMDEEYTEEDYIEDPEDEYATTGDSVDPLAGTDFRLTKKNDIASDVEAFLSRGGKISYVEPNVRAGKVDPDDFEDDDYTDFSMRQGEIGLYDDQEQDDGSDRILELAGVQKRTNEVNESSNSEYEINTWFERDRAHVALEKDGKTIVEWWDEDVQQAVEDGFLNPKDWLGSAVEYATEMGLLDQVTENSTNSSPNPLLVKYEDRSGTVQTAGEWIEDMGGWLGILGRRLMGAPTQGLIDRTMAENLLSKVMDESAEFNGYDTQEDYYADDTFPSGNHGSVSHSKGPASAKHGDNPLQSSMMESKAIQKSLWESLKTFKESSVGSTCSGSVAGYAKPLGKKAGEVDEARERKTEDEYTLMGNYGQGWEELTTEKDFKSIKERRKEYRENEGGDYKIVKKRVRKQQ